MPYKISDVFEAPAPGAWELEATHLCRPLSRWMATVFPDAATEGFKQGTARYGLLLDCLEFRVVNGFIYTCARGVGAPKGAKGPPPKPLFKLLLLLHPELRRRLRVAREAFATKSWRVELDRWDREEKAAVAKENQDLQKVDVRALTNDQLIDHLEACRTLVQRSITRHHRLNPVAMIPVGDLLVHARAWTGLPPSSVLPLLRGASAVSRGAEKELKEVVLAFKGRGDLQSLLSGTDGHSILETLCQAEGAAGQAVRRYVDEVGIRVTSGYDVADISMGEMPGLIVDTIRTAIAGKNFVSSDTVGADTERIRSLVPKEHRAEFDDLLSEARATYRMRDERAYLNDAWSTGVARKALLAAGERLAADGRLESPLHVFDLEPDELASALRGGAMPAARDIAEYSRYRTTKTVADAPPNLGLTPAGPPPADWLPPAAARMARAVEIVLNEMFEKREPSTKGLISGIAASPGDITGRARLVLKPADMANVQAGEILITRATAPSYNALLPLIRGVVTDRGGTLSHAAVVAREYGIPAVVGCGNATELIPDGAMVRIDGTSGTVQIVS